MPYRPTPKTEARKAAVRANLTDAATRLFSKQGYEATTLQQIVREAHTSIGNCYYYFPNKESLLLAVAENFRQEIAQEIDEATALMPLGPCLLAVAVYTGVMAVLRKPEIARFTLLNTVLPSLRSLATELFAARVQRAFEAMPDLFQETDITPPLAALAWQGAASHVLEGLITGHLVEEPHRAARFLACWNLRALGFSEEVIAQAMAGIDAE